MENKTKKMTRIIIVIAVFALAALAVTSAKVTSKTQKATSAVKKDTVAAKVSEPVAASQTVVYYFMTTYRCRSCTFIENTTKAAIEQNFAEKLKDGNMVFKAINIDEPHNKHYVNKYGLYTKTVIVSSIKDGKELKWKNLDQVWNLIGQDESFKAYVSSEIKTFLKS